MVIHLACPHCRKPLKARDDQAGQAVRCPQCQRPLVAPPDDAPTAPAGADRTATPTVLVVGDDADVRRVTALLAESLGYATAEAASGAEALSRLKDAGGEVVAVLLDVAVRGPDGAACQVLEARGPRLPVVVLGTAGSAVGGEPAAFLPKPFGREQLADAIRRALNA